MIRREDGKLAREAEVKQLDIRVCQRTLGDVTQRLGEEHIRRLEVSMYLRRSNLHVIHC